VLQFFYFIGHENKNPEAIVGDGVKYITGRQQSRPQQISYMDFIEHKINCLNSV
jgi:hypothetical protein